MSRDYSTTKTRRMRAPARPAKPTGIVPPAQFALLTLLPSEQGWCSLPTHGPSVPNPALPSAIGHRTALGPNRQANQSANPVHPRI